MYQIVTMGEQHVPQIAALEAASFSAPWDAASIRGELDNPLALWLAAADPDGTVLGYVGSQTVFEDTDILNVCVAPGARRRGIAEALMRTLEDLVRPKGAEQITLEVRASNEPALRLYEKLGYTRIGLRKGYYEKPREDALILQKTIIPQGLSDPAAETGEQV